MRLYINCFGNGLGYRGEVYSVALCLFVELDCPGTDVVDGEGDGWWNCWGDEQGQRIDPSILPKSCEQPLLEVIIRSSQWYVIEQMSDNISPKSLPCLSRSNQLINRLNSIIRISPPPLRFNLCVKNLSYRNNSKWMWHYSTSNTSDTCDHCFLSVTQIVVGFGWFDLVVYYGVDCVSDEEIGQSAI